VTLTPLLELASSPAAVAAIADRPPLAGPEARSALDAASLTQADPPGLVVGGDVVRVLGSPLPNGLGVARAAATGYAAAHSLVRREAFDLEPRPAAGAPAHISPEFLRAFISRKAGKGEACCQSKKRGCLSMQHLATEPRLGLRDRTTGRLVVAARAQGLEVRWVVGVAASVERYAVVDVEPVA
jgi:hypothetical protein